ncbi:TonB-dependent receptor [Sphingopyxis sp.]|uniref:TonB-dependent receptor n=1 Tax=Sphingopyxis sp. TaxID=1908224 RepID=UPI002610A047|nr:TonB-dependent receptor plug domain-containing protein [Sphingopyxis sp.]MCW0199427.1 TonB-dependent receptor plug domain-containing protein [Sphingopyxis sp.]
MRSKFLFTLGASVCALSAASANAEDGAATAAADPAPAAADTDAGDAIVVTARRREENAQDVPVAVTALSGGALQARGIVRSDDLQFAVPALRISPQISPATPSFVIRGQGRGLFQGALPAVVTYFADVPLPQDGSIVSLYDLQSVQVLKGPQGTLFGRNTTGGAILLTPTRPKTTQAEGYVEASIGNYDARSLTLAANVPLITDKLAVRVVNDFVRRDGFVKDIGGGPALGSKHSDSARLSVLATPTETFENLLIVDISRTDETGPAIVPTGVFTDAAGNPEGRAAAAGNYPFFFGGTLANDVRLQLERVRALGGILAADPGVQGSYRARSWGVVNTTRLDLGDITLKNIFGYRNAKVFNQFDVDGLPASINDRINGYGAFPQVAVDAVTNEFQILGGLLDKQLEFVVGAFYLNEGPTGESGSQALQFFHAGSPAPVVQNAYIRDKSKALFAQATWHFRGALEGLNLTGGYRHTWDNRSFCAIQQTQSVGPDQCAGIERKTRFNAPGYTLSLDYHVADRVLLYAAHRRGFRGGGVNTNVPANLIQGSYAPETVTDYEGGIKSDWRVGGMTGRFNFSYFRANISDFQASAVAALPLPGGGTLNSSIVANAAKAHTEGFEAELAITPVRGLTFTANYERFKGRFDKFDGPPGFPAGDLLSYQFNTPKYTLNLNGRYDIDLPAGLGDRIGLSVNLYRRSRTLISTTQGLPNQYNMEPAFNVVDLRAEWKRVADTPVDAALFVKNVGDTRYRVGMSNSASVFSLATSFYGDPRTYGLQLRYSF